jgi:hypothetical protein
VWLLRSPFTGLPAHKNKSMPACDSHQVAL